jgi:hypothetical protein
MIFDMQWSDLQTRVRELDELSTSGALVRLLVAWFRDNSDILRHPSFSSYRLENFCRLTEADYATEVHVLTPRELKRVKSDIDGYTASDLDLIPQYLRDLFTLLLVLDVAKDCPVCDSPGLGVYASCVTGRLAYECRQCGFAMYRDGSSVESRLRVATRAELQAANLL